METQAQSCTKIIIRVTVREKNVVGQREEVTGEGKEGTSIALNSILHGVSTTPNHKTAK